MLFIVAAVLFVAGMAMILIGDRIRKGQAAAIPQKFWDWFLSVVKRAFKILTGDAGPGEKVAAAGSILMAASVIAFVAAIVVAVGGDDGNGGGTTTTTTTTAPSTQPSD